MKPLAPFESSIAERYHEETKYSEEGLRREAAAREPLEWGTRPPPFKDYAGRRILLPTEGVPIRRPSEQDGAIQSDDEIERAGEGAMDLAKLARILWHTNGCTRIVGDQSFFHHFRAAPSAGAMYPTEVYVFARGVPGLPDGAYSYQLLDHSLATVRAGDDIEAVRRACFSHPAARVASVFFVLSAIWRRSSWRYRERGYRRALLDTGHVLGNLVLATGVEGLYAHPLGAFHDARIEGLLELTPHEEGPLAIVPVLAPDAAAEVPDVPSRRSIAVEWHRAVEAVADRFDDSPPERLIAAVHVAGRLEADAEVVEDAADLPLPTDKYVIAAVAAPTQWTPLEPVTDTIAERRSTRRFRPGSIPPGRLDSVLAFTCADPSRLLAPGLLRTYVVAIDAGPQLPPGTYLYEPGSAPRIHELSRGTAETIARRMHHLGLGQEIFAHAGAVVVHTADLTRAVARYGDRAYRSLGLDAGQLGERLNLAALREGLGVSGCGGYFDDEMNRALAIPESQAVIYITTLGIPA